jgi:hypothetical protein
MPVLSRWAQKRWPPPLGGDDWQGYMRWRFEDDASEDVVVDASTLDGGELQPATLLSNRLGF